MITNRQKIIISNLSVDLGKYLLTAVPFGLLIGRDYVHPYTLLAVFLAGVALVLIGLYIAKFIVN